jgi:ferredoxin-NADP reductase
LPSETQYRVSVKLELNGAAGAYLTHQVAVGDVLEVSEPRGVFTLRAEDRPVVLMSAGIGATPVLAMLHVLAQGGTAHPVWWLHGARNGELRSFAVETRQLLDRLPRSRSRIWYSDPSPQDREGSDYDAVGHMDVASFEHLGVPMDGDFYLCGPPGFLADSSRALAAWGVAADRIHSEIFGSAPASMPGVVGILSRPPHLPPDAPSTGPLISFARSGITTRWRAVDQSLLELAEACDVPVRWSCRSGVCHNCESGLISGSVVYQPEPLDAPAQGNVLICCSRPAGDVVIDL